MNELFVPAKIHPQRAQENETDMRPFTGGPRPEALIITCADCTLDDPLSWYFGEQPVFLLRTFGNEVSEFVLAHEELIEALEEAVCWWHVPQIIVCGHSGCRALLQVASKETNDPTLEASAPTTRFQSMLQRVGEANRNLQKAKYHTLEQLAALRSYPFIENGIHEQELQLSALFYLHESGLFLQYDETQRDYRPLM